MNAVLKLAGNMLDKTALALVRQYAADYPVVRLSEKHTWLRKLRAMQEIDFERKEAAQ